MTVPVARDQVTAGALVAQGDAVVRVENDSLMRVAVERPRDEDKVVLGALGELDHDPESAATAYYSIPYKDEGREVFVEGPSIKAALTLARRWGNCTTRAHHVGEDATGINLEGSFIDLETNFRVARPQRVVRYIVRRNGQIQELDPRRLQQAIQAGASKAMRNAILAGLPAYLVKRYFQHAKELVAGGKLMDKPAAAQIEKIQRVFRESFEISLMQLEGKLGKPAGAWTNDDVATLRGLYTAITDEQITVADAFNLKPPGAPTPNVTDPEQGTLDIVAASLDTTTALIADIQTLLDGLELSGLAERRLMQRLGIVGPWKSAPLPKLFDIKSELGAVQLQRLQKGGGGDQAPETNG